MVLTGPELIASFQQETRILLHLIGKVDPSKLDYRPTPKQRSTLELIRYLSMMGPELIRYGLSDSADFSAWTAAEQVAEKRTLAEAAAEIGKHPGFYQSMLGGVSDARYRSEFTDFEGKKTTRGAFLVNLGLCSCAAYRTQLFLYLKASGQEGLSSANLWSGMDLPAA